MRPLLVLAMLVVRPLLAHADMYRNADSFARSVELLIPDLRLESSVTFDGVDLTLSWPLAYRAGALALGDAFALGFTHFGELQYQTGGAVRGVLGERVTFAGGLEAEGWMPLVEVGGIVGQDGAGGVVGTGVAWGPLRDGVMFALVARYYGVVDEPDRVDLALDFQIPWNL